MIDIAIEPHRLTVRGHARPEDGPLWREVCAAVTTLATTLADNLDAQGVLYRVRTVGAGDVDLMWEHGGEDALTVVGHGLRHLARDYAAYINLEGRP